MLDEIKNIIRNRRSLYPKQYSEESIDKDIIEDILESANWAPSHKRTYPWHFEVFLGNALKELGDFQSELYKKRSESEGNFDQEKFDKLRNKPLLASHIIAICMKRDPKESIPEIEEICSVACAVQNMHLTATAYGLGAYWGTGGITFYEEAKPFFGLESKDKLLGFFYLGKLKKDFWPEGKRNDYKEYTNWR